MILLRCTAVQTTAFGDGILENRGYPTSSTIRQGYLVGDKERR